jgi:hypothetical protein
MGFRLRAVSSIVERMRVSNKTSSSARLKKRIADSPEIWMRKRKRGRTDSTNTPRLTDHFPKLFSKVPKSPTCILLDPCHRTMPVSDDHAAGTLLSCPGPTKNTVALQHISGPGTIIDWKRGFLDRLCLQPTRSLSLARSLDAFPVIPVCRVCSNCLFPEAARPEGILGSFWPQPVSNEWLLHLSASEAT